ncbi:MAG: SPOR domain-containing protein [Treponema sp.]|jgi:cell division septation protein DedD|nr:SPOR domain-containing protein [Treponema sp.]
MKRFGLFLFMVLFVSLLAIAADWEGTGTISSSGLLPDEGYYVATNAFPRNTIVNLTNIENRQMVRVIVASGLDSPGMLAMVSKDAADVIGLTNAVIGRIRLSLPTDFGGAFTYPEEIISSNADPDHNPRVVIGQRTETTPPTDSEFAAVESEQPAWTYPTDIGPGGSDTDISETFTPSAVTERDESIVSEVPPQPTWVYPQEIDGSLADVSSLAEEDLSNDTFIIIPGSDLAEESPEVSLSDDIPETNEPVLLADASAEPETVVEADGDFPETNYPPALFGSDDPSVAVITSQPIIESVEETPETEEIAVVPEVEEIYETPDTSIVVMEPGIEVAAAEDEDFPEIVNPPVLLGSADPSVAVVPSSILGSAGDVSETASIEAAQIIEDIEEVYETPNSSIVVMEPGIGVEDIPETNNPPVLLGSEDPSVTVIPSAIPLASQTASTSSSEETYETPGSSIAVVEPGITEDYPPYTEGEGDEAAVPVLAASENENEQDSPVLPALAPATETELAFIPTSERPPEGGVYNVPSSSGTSTVNPSATNQSFSVPVISSLENGYYVQLGAFSESDSVEQVIEDVGSAYPLKVQSAKSGSKSLYKVLLGPVNIGEGSALLQRFKTRGYSSAFITPTPRY